MSTGNIKELKEERQKQWGSSVNRGWDNYRASTFIEVIIAKLDRALIAQRLASEDEVNINKYEFDGTDSLHDALVYLQAMLDKMDKDPDFYIKNKMR